MARIAAFFMYTSALVTTAWADAGGGPHSHGAADAAMGKVIGGILIATVSLGVLVTILKKKSAKK